MTPRGMEPDLGLLKAQLIEGDDARYSFGAKRDLAEHIEMLRREFVGQSALLLLHAETIVRIRRQVEPDDSTALFWRMWREEGPFLLEQLDSRWLVSACDTIADVSVDAREGTMALLASTLVNTVKLYETEGLIDGSDPPEPGRYDVQKVQGRVSLFDGLAAYCLGPGNMIGNLLARIDAVSDPGGTADQILQELIRRLYRNNTVFRRFAECEKTIASG